MPKGRHYDIRTFSTILQVNSARSPWKPLRVKAVGIPCRDTASHIVSFEIEMLEVEKTEIRHEPKRVAVHPQFKQSAVSQGQPYSIKLRIISVVSYSGI